MSDLDWREAIIQVLKGSREVMRYTEIAEAIAKQELRREFGIVGDIIRRSDTGSLKRLLVN